jgi:hypothetical protein
MYNWSVNTSRLKKNLKKYTIWQLEQLINYGLGEKKLNKQELKKYFKELNISQDKKAYLTYILYGKKPTFS